MGGVQAARSHEPGAGMGQRACVDGPSGLGPERPATPSAQSDSIHGESMWEFYFILSRLQVSSSIIP